jgi:excisionase family DNA binding protein
MEQVLKELQELKKLTLLSAKNVLVLSDVEFLTGFSKSHIYKLTCAHQIPHYKPNGKQIYFDRGEIESWLKQNRVSTTKEAEQAAIAYVMDRKVNGKH